MTREICRGAHHLDLVTAYWQLMVMDEVAAAIRDVAETEVVPRFRALAEADVHEKSPGDLVTIADRECERVLTERLRHIRDVPVVGEEATSADASLLDLVADAPAVWVVDPIDGTSNFVAGNSNYVVMVALVEAGETSHAWIWHPETASMLTATRGGGVRRNGAVVNPPFARPMASGILKRKYMPEPARSRLGDFPESVGRLVPAFKSAGIEYSALVDGQIDFLMYWRTLPWDHAPGALIASEAGLRVGRLDGSPYLPGDGNAGLLAATSERWQAIADEINAAFS